MNQLKNCVSYAALFVLLALAGAASAQDRAPATFGSVGFGSGAAGPIGAGDLVEIDVYKRQHLGVIRR